MKVNLIKSSLSNQSKIAENKAVSFGCRTANTVPLCSKDARKFLHQQALEAVDDFTTNLKTGLKEISESDFFARAWAYLDPTSQYVLQKSIIEGLKPKEVAVLLGVSYQAIPSIRKTALKQLKKRVLV